MKPGGGSASISFKLAVRMRLPTDVLEALVEVRERLFCGDDGEWGLDAAFCPGESGCGKGTGVDTLALGDAMMGGRWDDCGEAAVTVYREMDDAARKRLLMVLVWR
jgi:hypothetical protein